MNATTYTNSAHWRAMRDESVRARNRMIAGIVFLMSLGTFATAIYMGVSLATTAEMPDDWNRVSPAQELLPIPTHKSRVEVRTLLGDRTRFNNFLTHDVTRHGGHRDYVNGRRVYVTPRWYYEELRALEFEQSASVDFDASIYVDWAKKMSGIPDRTEADYLVEIKVYFDTQSNALPWVGGAFETMLFLIAIGGIAGVVLTYTFPVVFQSQGREQQSKPARRIAGGDALEEQIAEAEKRRQK